MAEAAYRILRPAGSSRYVFLCDHASNQIPADVLDLGLPPSQRERHIAWDIGAAGVTEVLSRILDATAVLSNVSRLVIDCNRHPDAEDLVPAASDGIPIPGNALLSPADRAIRLNDWYLPYHRAISELLEQREFQGRETIPISIHSMTPLLAGIERPWPIALSSFQDRRLTDQVLAVLRAPGDILVGDNQPYDLDPAVDYTIPTHALSRGWPHLQVEFRQDEVGDREGQFRWAVRLAEALPH